MSDLDRLAHDFAEAPRKALISTRAVVARGSLNIKRDTQKRWTGLSHAPALPSAVTYDTRPLPHGAVGEIGPDKDKRQGALGNLIEYGSVHNAPRPGLAPSLEEEEPRFVKALEDLGVEATSL